MRRTRNTFQNGWIERHRGFFVYRWRERLPNRNYKKASKRLGPIEELKTEAQAWKIAERLKLSINSDNVQAQVWTFNALCQRFIEEEMSGLKLSTRTFYRPWFKNHIVPTWGEFTIGEIKPFAVREWLNKLPLSKKSRQHIRDLMKQVFRMAMLWEILPYEQNPIELVAVKGRADEEDAEKRVLTPEEFQSMLELIPDPYRTMCVIACCMGLRVSEILGLQWGDFDWERQEVKIQRAVVLAQPGKLKTPKSKATMPVDIALSHLLLEFKRVPAPNALEEDWLFPSSKTGRPWRPSRIQQNYIRTAGFQVTGEDGIGWHNFRHTFSTMLRELRTDIKVQQELLRHADVRTTLNV
jgi:integrase